MSRRFNVDMIPGGQQPAIHCNQFEFGDVWNFGLYYNGNSYSIPSGAKVYINGTKSDGAAFQVEGETSQYSENLAVFTVTKQMTAAAGRCVAELMVVAAGQTLYTANFFLLVQPAALQGDLTDTDIPSAIKDKDGNVFLSTGVALPNYTIAEAYEMLKTVTPKIEVEKTPSGAEVTVTDTEGSTVTELDTLPTDYVTPEQYGAKADGETDDTDALQAAIDSGKLVVCAGEYLITHVAAEHVHLQLRPEAVLTRKVTGEASVDSLPMIGINLAALKGAVPDRHSVITGGTIDAAGTATAIAANMCENLEISSCLIKNATSAGIYLGCKPDGDDYKAYSIESRIRDVKIWNVTPVAGTYGILDDSTDNHFVDIIVVNCSTGVRCGGNDSFVNVHVWLSNDSVFSGSVAFEITAGRSSYFTGCCSDSCETAFRLRYGAKACVSGFSQICSRYLLGKTIYYLKCATPQLMYFYSYGSVHKGNTIDTAFKMLDDNIFTYYQNNGPTYKEMLEIRGWTTHDFKDAASITNTPVVETGFSAEQYAQLTPYLGDTYAKILPYLGTQSGSFKDTQDMDLLTAPGIYGIRTANATNCPIASGIGVCLVGGSPYFTAQLLIGSATLYSRVYNGSTWTAWKQWAAMSDIPSQT